MHSFSEKNKNLDARITNPKLTQLTHQNERSKSLKASIITNITMIDKNQINI